MKTKTLILTAGLILIASLACAQSLEYKLQPGDILKITVHEQPDLTTKTRVSSEGQITFPLLGQVDIQNLTAQEAEQKIKHYLEQDYLVNAQVLVYIEQYRTREISVLGQVKKPGKFTMPDEKMLTFLEAIAQAGGFRKEADRDKCTIMRLKDGKKETLKVKVTDITKKGKPDITLRQGDVIFVPESFF